MPAREEGERWDQMSSKSWRSVFKWSFGINRASVCGNPRPFLVDFIVNLQVLHDISKILFSK